MAVAKGKNSVPYCHRAYADSVKPTLAAGKSVGTGRPRRAVWCQQSHDRSPSLSDISDTYHDPPWQPDPVTVYNLPALMPVLAEHMRHNGASSGPTGPGRPHRAHGAQSLEGRRPCATVPGPDWPIPQPRHQEGDGHAQRFLDLTGLFHNPATRKETAVRNGSWT
jgi:hypothetical protein